MPVSPPLPGSPRPAPPAGVLSTVGHTPLIRLVRLLPGQGLEVYAKLEGCNPGGSTKDRPALRLVREALKSGLLQRRSVLIEPSAGNLAVSLAQVCAALELRLLVVVDPQTSPTVLKLLQAYGAAIERVTQPDPEPGDWATARRRRAAQLVAATPGAVTLDPESNPVHASAQRDGTIAEILDALEYRVDWLVLPVGSAATLQGARQWIRERGLTTRVVAVEMAGRALFGQTRPRVRPGPTADLSQGDWADLHLVASDTQCVAGARWLLAREAILAGSAGGAAAAALHRLHGAWPEGTRVALVLPDRGERFLDTVYDDDWCERQFGSVPQLDPLPVARAASARHPIPNPLPEVA